ncbi:uncharacterized protein LOC122502228 [Leptopilina heterotoma]|uniref:uncharacterized protein LOC122502228 n=1 Tax=Leptopilina heterotoma TaxID=63436 RepID=UPI001CA8C966|nr:uncharacterized protein LOC122502228 [Leptopilina heterotoma]
MGKCFLCGKLPDAENNINLYKFPRNDDLYKKWLLILGLERKELKRKSYLCSNHFNSESFTIPCNGSKKFLKPGSTPTALAKEVKLNSSVEEQEALKMHDGENICHDRHYTNTFQSMTTTIAKIAENLDSLKKENKILRQQTNHLKTKIIYQHSLSNDVDFTESRWNNILKFDYNS